MMTNCAKPGFRMQGHEVTPLRAPLISSESEHAVSIVRLLAYAPPSLRHSSRAFSNSAISDTSVESSTGSSVSRASSYLRDTVQWTLVGAWRALSFRRATRDAFIARQTAFAMESTPPNSPIASAPLRGPAWPQVGITIANALVGAGCLGLPYALRNAGWAGLIIILGATLATCCTAKFLVQCIESLNARKVACSTYDDLVEFQFGSLGGVLMRVMTVAELYGGVVCMVTLQATNWPVLLGLPEQPLASLGLTQHIPRMLDDAHVLVTLLVCALAFPTLLVQTRHLAGFAAVGLCATATVAFVTLAAPLLNSDLPLADGASCPSLDASTRPADSMGRETLRLEGVGVATGLALFAFAGHATFPEMWRQMSASERPHFGKACDLGFGLAAVFYCTLAATGYFFFGNCAADTLTLNLMAASPARRGGDGRRLSRRLRPSRSSRCPSPASAARRSPSATRRPSSSCGCARRSRAACCSRLTAPRSASSSASSASPPSSRCPCPTLALSSRSSAPLHACSSVLYCRPSAMWPCTMRSSPTPRCSPTARLSSSGWWAWSSACRARSRAARELACRVGSRHST